MRNRVLSIAALLVFSQLAEAQAPVDAVPGMFGSRRLGLPLMARSSGFGAGIEVAPNGSIIYPGRPAGIGAFPTPWRRTQPVWLPQSIAAPVPSQVLLQGLSAIAPLSGYGAPELPVPEFGAPQMAPPEMLPEVTPTLEEPAAEPSAETPAEGGTPPATDAGSPEATAIPTTQNVAPAVSNVTIPQVSTRTALRIGDRSSLRRTAEVSERLTRIARDRGVLASPAIDVYLSGRVAILHGTVRTAHDRDLLANVAGLEPGVQQVYNGLTTEGSGDVSRRDGAASR